MTRSPQTPPEAELPTAYINLIAEIVPRTVEALTALTSDLVNRGHTAIYLMISSPGGSVSDGIALYHYLRSLPIKLTAHNTGSVNSIANIVFLAAETRRTCTHTNFMFHGVSMQTQAPQSFERKALRESLASVEGDEKRIGGIVAERTRLSQETIDTFFLEARTLSPEEALAAGIVHAIDQVRIPKGCPVFSLVFQG